MSKTVPLWMNGRVIGSAEVEPGGPNGLMVVNAIVTESLDIFDWSGEHYSIADDEEKLIDCE